MKSHIKKKATASYGVMLKADGMNPIFVGAVAIPDHWNIKASQWQKAEARGQVVKTRTEMDNAFRRWRNESGERGIFKDRFKRLINFTLHEGAAKLRGETQAEEATA